ncbi:MAG: hypothetical protein M3O91_02685 [Chloroflexota bacterium]|nr:hypothetical protein [Chloroflexota bacterium]
MTRMRSRGVDPRHRRRSGAAATLVSLVLGAVIALVVLEVALGGTAAPPREDVGPSAKPDAASPVAPPPPPPELTFDPPAGRTQAARFLSVRFGSSVALESARITLAPDPGFACSAQLEAPKLGRFGCVGLLPGPVDFVATLSVRAGGQDTRARYDFRTMGPKLEGVRWFTEFEDPAGDPLACAAASCRIVQFFTAGDDKMTASGILNFGRQFNRSRDPGLDPAAIAEVLHRLESRNAYHYYRLDSREEATKAAVYWLLRSGKPVLVVSLAGQHAPVLIGYRGEFGTFYGDPLDHVTGVIMEDPQRGDLDPRTANRRPDKYRSADFQTGRLLALPEWYGDEWWLAFPYTCCLNGVSIDRSDGAYPLPHWAGKYVIVVDDEDAEWPSDREGRVRFN